MSNSLSTGISIEAPLVTIESCSFAFLRYCIYCPEGKSAAELDFRFNRFASSQYGVVLRGGQINSRFLQNTFADCKCGLFITEDPANVSTAIEGIKMQGDLFYACGDDTTLGAAGIEINACRWIWLTDVMVDLSHGVALRGTNTSFLRVTNGYYSSNHSSGSSCVVLRGNSPECQFDGVMFSDSREWGLTLLKTADGSPARTKLRGCLFQNNDINASQQGDLLLDSVTGVTASECTFLTNKPTGIALTDNQGGGCQLTTNRCYFYGHVFVATVACKFFHYDSPTHPDKQQGISTIPNGSSSLTLPSSIISLISGRGISVVPASGSQIVTIVGAYSGGNYVFNRTGTSGDNPFSYLATLIQN